MNKITVDIDDYLTETDKREIAVRCFSDACTRRTQDDFERILSNCAYQLVQKEVDAAFDGDMITTVKEKAIQVIKKLSNYTIFKMPDVWDKVPSKGWEYLQQAIDDNKSLINERVTAAIESISDEKMSELISDRLTSAIIEKLTRKDV